MSLSITTKTWNRDSHGLFDYESQGVTVQHFSVTSSCTLIRSEDNVELQIDSPAGQILLTIKEENGQFFLIPGEHESIWLIVKHLSTLGTQGCVLDEGATVKLGRVKLNVKETRGLDDTREEVTESSIEGLDVELPTERETVACRVCLVDDFERHNPLVTPCGCTGSVKYLHLECLQKWIASRKTIKHSENSVNVTWKAMDCEICKTPYPASLHIHGKKHDLFHSEKPMKPYIILESYNNETFVISFLNQFTVKVGRGHDSDIRVSDISVSRVHANISYRAGQFVLDDNNSKFGSLLLLTEPIVLSAHPLRVQIGRTVFTLTTD